MSKDNVELIVAIVGCLMGLGGVAAAAYTRWKASIEKGYAAQRDFAHLRRNQEQISEGIGEIAKDFEDKLHRVDLTLNRIESMMHTMLAGRYQHRRHEDDEEKFH